MLILEHLRHLQKSLAGALEKARVVATSPHKRTPDGFSIPAAGAGVKRLLTLNGISITIAEDH